MRQHQENRNTFGKLSEQDTIPLPIVPLHKRPTFKQLRESLHLSYFEIAIQAGVKVRVVYWMELGYTTEFPLAVRIMRVLSRYAGYGVRLEHIQGVHVKMSFVY